MDEVHSPSELVRSPHQTEILGKLVDGRVCDRRHRGPAEHAELITDADVRDLWHFRRVIDFCSQFGRREKVLGRLDRRGPKQGTTEGTDHVRTERVRIAQNNLVRLP